jgi:hypothetical protein
MKDVTPKLLAKGSVTNIVIVQLAMGGRASLDTNVSVITFR